MNYFDLEHETGRLTMAMITRNAFISADLIDGLRTELPLQTIAGIAIVSLSRLLWSHPESVCWTVENLIPADLMLEIRRIFTTGAAKQLISLGFIPGKDFSLDNQGRLLMNDCAKAAVTML